MYPFCAPCTAGSEPWRPTDVRGPTGSRFYGHRDVCVDCGSSVRTLYRTVLWFPVTRIGRFRIIRTGGRSYVGRRVTDRPAQTAVPTEPVSAVGDHPELEGDVAYKQAEVYWDEGEPGRALPFYQAALAEWEKVLAADDPATLRVRLRVAQGLLATGNYGRAIAWFELVTPHLTRVLGTQHELTRAATEAVAGARVMVGGPRSEARLLADVLAAAPNTAGTDAAGSDTAGTDAAGTDAAGDSAEVLRHRAALGKALLACGDVSDSVEALSQVVRDAGPDHPDTAVYRAALLEACEVAEARGKRRDAQLARAARQLLNRADAPTAT